MSSSIGTTLPSGKLILKCSRKTTNLYNLQGACNHLGHQALAVFMAFHATAMPTLQFSGALLLADAWVTTALFAVVPT